jgi:hypothetical protein
MKLLTELCYESFGDPLSLAPSINHLIYNKIMGFSHFHLFQMVWKKYGVQLTYQEVKYYNSLKM